ncbi:mandelate racemase [Marinibaculum pumilum]|uniref:Mandelate racemase n=1 Tax=Marinibaculum pumilum TaxID=1766165 RepID=A0ABV7L575_9PROT
MSKVTKASVVSIDLFERPVVLRMPFRFGIVTLTHAPQVFVRLKLADGSTGIAAEMLAPKWFDKNPDLTNEQNFDQLRRSLLLAAERTLAGPQDLAPFALHAAHEADHHAACAAEGLNGLVAGFGLALVDRAIIDAVCRRDGVSVFRAVAENRLGIGSDTAPDLQGFDIGGFLAGLAPAATIEARHTVGLVDSLTDADIPADARLDDGLPQSLEAAVATYGLRSFKLKVQGDVDADIDRLCGIAAVIDAQPAPYRSTLDGNEQYRTPEAVLELWHRIAAEPRLERLRASILFIEQPIARAAALSAPLGPLAEAAPVEVDESDADIDVFPRAKALGYGGISSKSCKGFYRSLLNRARTAAWNEEAGAERYFMSAEDLTTQAGVAVQQDLALATLIGCSHVERNGHHYVDGMAGAPEAEQAAFLSAHPDIYHRQAGRARLNIRDGSIAIGSLDTPGLGVGPLPDWQAMDAMPKPGKISA